MRLTCLHLCLNELTIRELKKIEQYKIFTWTRTRCIVPPTNKHIQELGLIIVEASSHSPWKRQDQMLTFSTCLLISVASFSTTWVPSFGRVNFGRLKTWTSRVPHRRCSTSPMTDSCHFSRIWETITRLSFWQQRLTFYQKMKRIAWWSWFGGMSFKQKQRLVSPRQNWFLRTCSSFMGIRWWEKGHAAIFEVKFGKRSKKTIAQLSQARVRTTEQLFLTSWNLLHLLWKTMVIFLSLSRERDSMTVY